MALDITTVALICLILLGAGYAVVLSLLLVPRMAPTAREILPILHTEALIVGTAAGVLWIGGWVMTLALTALTLRVGYEAASVALRPANASKQIILGVTLAFAALVLAFATQPLWTLLLPVIAALLIAWALTVAGTPDANTSVGVAAALAAFPGLPLLIFVSAANHGLAAWLLVAFLLVETFDSYALLGGKLFGRRKAFPTLSPRKTVEGLAIGAAMLMVTAGLVGKFVFGAPLFTSAVFALFVGVLAVAGDLAASRLKRRGGVKDYPPVLRAQGGLLDITDAWIAAGAGVAAILVLIAVM